MASITRCDRCKIEAKSGTLGYAQVMDKHPAIWGPRDDQAFDLCPVCLLEVIKFITGKDHYTEIVYVPV